MTIIKGFELQPRSDKPPRIRSITALRPYLSLLRGQYRDLFLTSVLMLISTGISLATPLYAGRFVDALRSYEGSFDVNKNYLLLLGLLLVGQLFGTFFSSVIGARLGLRTVTRLRKKVYTHLLELPSLFFSNQKAGDISSRVTGDVGSIQYMLTNGIFGLVRSVLTIIGASIMMLKLNPKLTTAVLLLIPMTIGLTKIFGTRLQNYSRKMYDELGNISSQVQETVGGIQTLKVYNAQTHESNRFNEMIMNYREAGMKRAWYSAAFSSGLQIISWVSFLVIVIYGFALMNSGQTSSGELVAFMLLTFRVALPLSSLGQLFTSAQGAIAAADRLHDIFALKPEREPDTPAPKSVSTPPSIRLNNVSFKYPESDLQILDDLEIEIKKGQLVGIVGPSGAGKTTMAGLILGLFPPSEGQLFLDDQPYTEYDISELRSRMAWVAQDPVLYDLSMTDNIRFGFTSATEEEVLEAAEQANVMEFVNNLPKGLESTCGERGGRLSGGQRQRVALARAFLRNPGLLVLDEPTSALDAASEDSILQAMRKLMKGRTAVVIAHRFSLVKDLDLILVMKQGRIVQKGSHQELMTEGGLYKTLFEMQQGESKI